MPKCPGRRKCCPRINTRYTTGRRRHIERVFTVSPNLRIIALERANCARTMLSNIGVCCRIAQVDESQPTYQPSWFLNLRQHPNYLESCLPAIYHTDCLPMDSGQESACSASRIEYPPFCFGRYARPRLQLYSNTLLYITWL